MSLRRTCRVLLVANIAYCTLAAVRGGLPAWSMFESVESAEYSLSDRSGRGVSVHDYLPRNAMLMSPSDVDGVAAFVCRTEPARTPLTLRRPSSAEPVTIAPPDCSAHVATK